MTFLHHETALSKTTTTGPRQQQGRRQRESSLELMPRIPHNAQDSKRQALLHFLLIVISVIAFHLNLIKNNMLRPSLMRVVGPRPRILRALTAAAVAGGRHASTLVVAEHSAKGTLSASTLSTITAAGQFKNPITVLVAGGPGMDAVAKQAAQVAGVSKVLVAEHAAYEKGLAENVSQAIVAAHKAGGYSHILAPSSMRSKNIIPRVAAVLDTQPVTDVIQIVDEATFVRPMYAGNAIATVKTSEPLKILTVRATAFDKAPATGGSATTEAAPAVGAPDAGLSTFVSENVSQSARPELASARVVISGGRGLKTKENFAMLETLADKLKGAVGASRAAVDEFHMPNELQVGQTGKVVAPDLYVAVGISGAIQHLSGMKDSKVIVAINKDKEAPIFQVADYGLVGDLFQAVPELTEKL